MLELPSRLGSTTLTGSPRSAFLFALTVFATTMVQVLVIPVTAFVDGTTDWGLPLTEPLVVTVLVIGCAVQAAVLVLSDGRPRLAVVLTTATYLLLAVGLGVPSWLSAMYLVIAIALFLLAARTTALESSLWAVGAIIVSMGTLLIWLLLIGTGFHVAIGYVLGETARFAAPVAGGTALGFWWGVQLRRVTLAREEAALAKEEHARRVSEAQRVERARIAQELHDVAGQHLAGLITLSNAALAIAPERPASALELINEVRSEGRFAAASLASALSDLRATGDEPAQTAADLLGAPELIEYWSRMGMVVRLSTNGDLDDLPAVVSSVGYRVLQESLTNAAKHAPGSGVDVRITVTGHLHLIVRNGRSLKPEDSLPGLSLSWGIEGMRQRVELLRGTLVAGPTQAGGWEVNATIPVTAHAG